MKDLRLTLARDQKPHLQVPRCLHVTESSIALGAARWDLWSNEHLVREAVPDTHPREPASSSLFAWGYVIYPNITASQRPFFCAHID